MIEISEDISNFVFIRSLELTVILLVLQILSWRFFPTIWTGEKTDGKKSGNRNGYILYLLLFFCALTAYLIYADQKLLELTPLMNQSTIFVVNVFILGIYCLADLFLIDFLIYIRFRPKLMEIPGVAINTSYWHHIKIALLTMLYGSVFCFIASLIAHGNAM